MTFVFLCPELLEGAQISICNKKEQWLGIPVTWVLGLDLQLNDCAISGNSFPFFGLWFSALSNSDFEGPSYYWVCRKAIKWGREQDLAGPSSILFPGERFWEGLITLEIEVLVRDLEGRTWWKPQLSSYITLAGKVLGINMLQMTEVTSCVCERAKSRWSRFCGKRLAVRPGSHWGTLADLMLCQLWTESVGVTAPVP